MSELIPGGYKYHLIKKESGSILASFTSKECCKVFVKALQHEYKELNGLMLLTLQN